MSRKAKFSPEKMSTLILRSCAIVWCDGHSNIMSIIPNRGATVCRVNLFRIRNSINISIAKIQLFSQSVCFLIECTIIV
jgi:hypothetical protein